MIIVVVCVIRCCHFVFLLIDSLLYVQCFSFQFVSFYFLSHFLFHFSFSQLLALLGQTEDAHDRYCNNRPPNRNGPPYDKWSLAIKLEWKWRKISKTARSDHRKRSLMDVKAHFSENFEDNIFIKCKCFDVNDQQSKTNDDFLTNRWKTKCQYVDLECNQTYNK